MQSLLCVRAVRRLVGLVWRWICRRAPVMSACRQLIFEAAAASNQAAACTSDEMGSECMTAISSSGAPISAVDGTEAGGFGGGMGSAPGLRAPASTSLPCSFRHHRGQHGRGRAAPLPPYGRPCSARNCL